jgi:hypothetical protein
MYKMMNIWKVLKSIKLYIIIFIFLKMIMFLFEDIFFKLIEI